MSENFVESGGARIWTVQTGAGMPVMLCSGGPGCCDYLQPVASMLDGAAQVIRFEQRGCGRSDALPPFDIETSLADLESVRRHYGVERWIIGGHSWGADLALFYALKHPKRVAGLICIAGGRIHNDREWHGEYDRNRTQKGEQMPDFAYPFNAEVNRQVSGAWKKRVQKTDLLKSLSELQTPALFVYAENDIRPRWATEQIASLMPNASFELVEGAEHYIWLSHADELKSRLCDFVGCVRQKEAQYI